MFVSYLPIIKHKYSYLILNSKKLTHGKNNIIIIIIKKQDSDRSGTSAQVYRRLETGVQYSHASKFLLSYCGPPRSALQTLSPIAKKRDVLWSNSVLCDRRILFPVFLLSSQLGIG